MRNTCAACKWIGVPDEDFLFPVTAVSRLFRGKFLAGFIDRCKAGSIDLTEHHSRTLVRELQKQPWVVYAKKPFGGPTQIINYLGRYTHRVAISSSRLLSIADEQVVFRTRGQKTCSLTPEEFIRRFLLHVLPHQFLKIRHYGLLAPGNVNTRLRRAQQLLGPIPTTTADHDDDDLPVTDTGAAPAARSTSDPAAPKCPHCGGRLVPLPRRTLHLVEQLPPPDT